MCLTPSCTHGAQTGVLRSRHWERARTGHIPDGSANSDQGKPSLLPSFSHSDVWPERPWESGSRNTHISSPNCERTVCVRLALCFEFPGFCVLRIASIPKVGRQSKSSFICLQWARLGDESKFNSQRQGNKQSKKGGF